MKILIIDNKLKTLRVLFLFVWICGFLGGVSFIAGRIYEENTFVYGVFLIVMLIFLSLLLIGALIVVIGKMFYSYKYAFLNGSELLLNKKTFKIKQIIIGKRKDNVESKSGHKLILSNGQTICFEKEKDYSILNTVAQNEISILSSNKSYLWSSSISFLSLFELLEMFND